VRRILIGLCIVCMMAAAAAADYIHLPRKWSQTPYDAEQSSLPISDCEFSDWVWADDFLCQDTHPIVAVRWWGLYGAARDPMPPGHVDAHISFHLSQGEHPTSVPFDEPVAFYTVSAQQEAVGYSSAWGTTVYRYDAYLPEEFDQWHWSHEVASEVPGANIGELFIDICVPDPDYRWLWLSLSQSDTPILDWPAFSNSGHSGPWVSRGDMGYSMSFELMTPEPATMALLGLGLAGLIARRRRRP